MPLTAPAIKGYCTTDDIAAFLGVTFTSAQLPQVTATIGRTESWLDGEINRAWLTGPITNEAVFSPFGLDPPSFFTSYVAGWVPLGAAVLTKQAPIVSVERVQGVGWLGTPPLVLVANLDYEVRLLDIGYIRLTVPSAYYKLLIDYTPAAIVPGDITQATIMMAATYLLPMLSFESWLVDSVQLPDLTVKYSSASNTQKVPPEVTEIIEKYRFRSLG